jgi:hypothetical protein
MKVNDKSKRRSGSRHSGTEKGRDPSKKVESNQPFMLNLNEKERFTEWKEALTIEVKIKLGDAGRLLDTDKYPIPGVIDPLEFDLDNDKFVVNKAMMIAAVSERQKTVTKLMSRKAPLYSMLLKYLSKESTALVYRYEKFDMKKDVDDPEKLWIAIKATHRPGADAVDPTVRRAQTRIAFNACIQGTEEPIHVFYRRYQYAYETMIDAGNAKIDEKDI